MSKETALITLGVFTALFPFSGFPGSWKTIIFVFFGGAVALLGFLLRIERRQDEATHGERRTSTYVENGIPFEQKTGEARSRRMSSSSSDAETQI